MQEYIYCFFPFLEILSKKKNEIIVQTWKELAPIQAQQLEISRNYNYFIFIIVYLALAFGIINAFMMEIFERIKELGIMMSLGTKPFNIFLTIIYESIILGVLGSLIGTLLSFIFINGLLHGRLNISAFAGGMHFLGLDSILPLIITKDTVVKSFFGTIIAVICAAIYPAIRAASFKPVEALRHF